LSNPTSIVWMVALGLTAVTFPVNSDQVTVARSQWDGVFTNAQAGRGRVAYEQHCANCHGSDLGGLPQEVRYAGQLSRTPSLVGDAFVSKWEGLTLGDLHERIQISMPQERPGSLPAQTIADILAFMLQEEHCPAGATELPALRSELRTIAFLKAKP
jgi:cytochrome c